MAGSTWTCLHYAFLLAPVASNLKDNGNAVKILEKLGVDPSKMPEEIIKDLMKRRLHSGAGVGGTN